jgi:hypothetical protein
MPAVDQLEDTLRILREEGGGKLFLAVGGELPDLRPALEAAGFGMTAEDREGDELWVAGAPRSGGAP